MAGVPDPPQTTSEWLSYRAAVDRLRLENTAAVRARARGGWPTRMSKDTGEAEILVPAAELAQAALKPANKRETLSLAGAVQAAKAPLQAALQREERANKELEAALEVARAEVAAVKVEAAKIKLERETIDTKLTETTARLERAERDRQILEGKAHDVRSELQAAQLQAAQAAGKAATELAKRQAAEREAVQLRSQLEALQAKPRRRWWWP
jgi:hypothetical protein